MKMHELYNRSVAKTITYRIALTTTSYIVLVMLTGSQTLALSFSGISLIYGTVIYYVHERIWARIDWGIK
jgi:uncharacterized membrane protein